MSDNIINVYCDESCHLENEECKTMVVACIRCPQNKVKSISNDIIALKKKHKIWKYAEIKWTKVSKSKIDFYLELLEYFFNNPHLRFRAIVVPNKRKLNHPAFKQNHNTFYYKMIYQLVDYFLRFDCSYNIYADKKESSYNAKKQMHLTRDYLQAHCSQPIKMENITSYKSELMQLNDFLQGAVCFYNRELHNTTTNIAKIKIIEAIETRSIVLNKNQNHPKFNILIWRPNKK